MQRHYGHYARILHSCTDQTMTNALAQLDLTAAQGHIIGYLARRETMPCARDIEEEFQLSHPTISGLLSRLEKKGFIEFREDENDRRCKRIWLSEKGWECDERIHQLIRETEARMVQDFTEQEKQQFADLLERAIRNMGCGPCERKHKEEPKR